MKIKKHTIKLFIIPIIFSIFFINITLAKAVDDSHYIIDIHDKTTTFSQSAGIYEENPRTPQEITISIINIILGLLGLGFLILIIVSGIQWMTSGGNEEKVTKARKNIINAVIGLAIVLAAYVISNFIFENIQKATEDPYFWL